MRVTANSKTILPFKTTEPSVTAPRKRKASEEDLIESKPGAASHPQMISGCALSSASSSPKVAGSKLPFLFLESKKNLSIYKNDIVDLVTKKNLNEMLEDQKTLGVPLILAQCQCSAHSGQTDSVTKKETSHPEFLDGSLVYEKFDGDWFAASRIKQLDAPGLDALEKFSRNNFLFYLVNPHDRKSMLLASKAMMQQDIKDDRIVFTGAYTLNGLDLSSSEGRMEGMFTAAMYHAGLRVEKDSEFARQITSKMRPDRDNSLDAELLTMAVADHQNEILKALLELGIDARSEREEGGTVLDYAHRMKNNEAVDILEAIPKPPQKKDKASQLQNR